MFTTIRLSDAVKKSCAIAAEITAFLFTLTACSKTVTKTMTITLPDTLTVTNTIIDSMIRLDSGLVAYYPFNGNVNDSTSNHLDGIITGGVTFTADVAGNANSAATFDGTTAFILVNDPNNKFQVDAVTVSCLINLADNTSPQDFVVNNNYTDGTGISYGLGISADGATYQKFQFGAINPSVACGYAPLDPTNAVTAANVAAQNQWYHITGIFSNGLEQIYVNGVLNTAQTRTFTTNNKCNTNSLVLGGFWKNGGQLLHGSMDEVRVYNRALNQNEITELARAVN